MTDSDDFTRSDLALQQVTKIDNKELGRGAHGRVDEVNYLDKISAIKQIQSKVW